MRIELPAERTLVYETTMPIRWGDMDAMGHVNNTVYFRYMESARIEWFERFGCPVDPQGEGPVIGNAFCNFLRQLEYPGVLRVRTYVGAVGNSSFDTYHEILLDDDAEARVRANGGATVVWVNFPEQRAVPLPERIRQALRRSF
ncbi:thioesterase family protein [Tibeticola sp.]|uniref:acyl-CoA thioesterase n=1 Tax=Tibeticola sp. TaxID=2005368 RepID=UPI00258548CF|nr:thioesterase family protein [Tibeticola sp.]MCI4440429.1 acyl-CoA thioesterase [Tibeticola sp.]